MELNAQARMAIESHALQCYPNEACGVILDDTYFACTNTADDPARRFVIAADEYARAEDRGGIQAIVHSHPDTSALPSLADLLACEASSVPVWVVVHVYRGPDGHASLGRIHMFSRAGATPSLVGVPFVHGSSDCFGIVQRYYRAAFGLVLPDFERSGLWWNDGQTSLYVDNYAAAGFISVGRDADLREGDVLLMAIASRHAIPNHAAVYVGHDEILHHLWNQLSRRDAFPRYRAHVTHVLRHKDALEWSR